MCRREGTAEAFIIDYSWSKGRQATTCSGYRQTTTGEVKEVRREPQLFRFFPAHYTFRSSLAYAFSAGFHANQASRQRLEELHHLAASQLLANDDLSAASIA
jgi:hypothetical protein